MGGRIPGYQNGGPPGAKNPFKLGPYSWESKFEGVPHKLPRFSPGKLGPQMTEVESLLADLADHTARRENLKPLPSPSAPLEPGERGYVAEGEWENPELGRGPYVSPRELSQESEMQQLLRDRLEKEETERLEALFKERDSGPYVSPRELREEDGMQQLLRGQIRDDSIREGLMDSWLGGIGCCSKQAS